VAISFFCLVFAVKQSYCSAELVAEASNDASASTDAGTDAAIGAVVPQALAWRMLLLYMLSSLCSTLVTVEGWRQHELMTVVTVA
jgi:hypothetical protein